MAGGAPHVISVRFVGFCVRRRRTKKRDVEIPYFTRTTRKIFDPFGPGTKKSYAGIGMYFYLCGTQLGRSRSLLGKK